MRHAVQAVVKSRNIASHDQGHDARVVQLVAPFGDVGAVIAQRVEGGTHAETDGGAAEEAAEDEDVAGGGAGIPGGHDVVQEEADEGEDQTAEQVGPDVDGLVVQPEQRPGRPKVRVGRLAVPRQDVVVVAPPRGQVVPEDEQCALDLGLDLLGLGHHRLGGGRGRPALPEASCCRWGVRPGAGGRAVGSHLSG